MSPTFNINHQTLVHTVNSHSIIAQTKANGVITYVNEKFCEISGYEIKELIGKTHAIINSGHHTKKFFDTLWNTISNGKVWQGEICNRSKGGALYWVNTTIFPELDKNKNIISYLSIRTETTKDKLSAVLLHAEQEAMQSIINGDPLSVAIMNVLERIHKFDENYMLSILELKDENKLYHLGQIGLAPHYIEAINGLEIKDGVGTCGTCAYRKEEVYVDNVSEHPYWEGLKVLVASADIASCWSTPIIDRDNNLFGTLALYSSTKRMPNALERYLQRKTAQVLSVLFLFYRHKVDYQKQTRKLDNIIQLSPMCIFEIDLSANMTSMNRSGLKMFSIEEEKDIIGMSFLMMPKHNKDKKKFKEHFKNAMTGLGSDFEFTSDLNGHPCYYWVCLIPLTDNTGNVTNILGITEDITVRHHNQQLLKEKAHVAEEANIAKSNFLAAMSHELRTPLNAILGFSEILKQGYFGDKIENKNAEYIQHIHDSGKNMLKLVNEILDLTLVETGRIHLNEEEIDVNSFFSQLNTALSKAAHSKNISFIYCAPDKELTLNGDKKTISAIYNNIVNNAINHTPHKGTVEIHLKHSDSNGLSIIVTDEGPGFNDHAIKNLNQPFRQDNAYKTTKNKGPGLGLYLTRRYADLHSANINVSNKRPRGANVEIIFPAQRVSKVLR